MGDVDRLGLFFQTRSGLAFKVQPAHCLDQLLTVAVKVYSNQDWKNYKDTLKRRLYFADSVNIVDLIDIHLSVMASMHVNDYIYEFDLIYPIVEMGEINHKLVNRFWKNMREYARDKGLDDAAIK